METNDDSHSLKVIARLDSMRKEFEESFRPNSRAGVWLISSINRNIAAYGLVDIDAWDVLIEAYIRAVKFVTNEGLIWNLVSWLKSASILIIHEHRRKFDRLDTTSIPEMDWFQTDEFSPQTEVLDVETLAESLRSSLETLSQVDRDLLLWRVNDGFSWETIRQFLIERGEPSPSYAALRQRKQRAVGKLKRAFLSTGARISGLSEQEFKALCHSFRELGNSRNVIK